MKCKSDKENTFMGWENHDIIKVSVIRGGAVESLKKLAGIKAAELSKAG